VRARIVSQGFRRSTPPM